MSVPSGRRFVRATLSQWGLDRMKDRVELVASELITNALLHAASPAQLRIEKLPDRVRLELGDESESLPQLTKPNHDATSGRGVFLIDTVTSCWGITPTDTGKTIWCDFLYADDPTDVNQHA